MRWEKSESGASRHVLFIGQAAPGLEDEALKEMWDLVATEILPLNADVEWDYIRLEIWADSGRMIVYPASSQSPYRIEKANCQVVLASLLQESERIDAWSSQFLDADGYYVDAQAEARFVEAHDAMELQWLDKAEAAARARLPHGSNLKLRFYSFDDEEPLREVTL